MNLETLRHQHDSLFGIAGELGRAIAAPDPRPVASIRWRLARELLAHLAMEDSWLYPRLARSPSARTAELATRFKAEMGGLAATFNRYMTHWTDQRIAADWTGFRKETSLILAQIRTRIERENGELYPLAAQQAETPTRAA
ncbi:MAG: hemerythrin domain-containing protein [Sphingobium sp.]